MALDLAGRHVLITGANTGIGRSTALALARRGAHLILAGRSRERSAPVLAEIERLACAPAPAFVPLDLADSTSIRACAASVAAMTAPLHVLINNAGQGGGSGLTKDGYEITIGTNHLGPFLLTLLLLDKLKASAPSRVVVVASRAHRRVKNLDFAAWRRPRQSWLGVSEYAASKLANVLFVRALARRLEGTGVTTYAVHPGVVASSLWRRVPAPVRALMTAAMISSDEGAATSVHCAVSPDVADETGLYYAQSQAVSPTAVAQDDELAEQMWTNSVLLVGKITLL